MMKEKKVSDQDTWADVHLLKSQDQGQGFQAGERREQRCRGRMGQASAQRTVRCRGGLGHQP